MNNKYGSARADSIFTYIRNVPVINFVSAPTGTAGTPIILKGTHFDPVTTKNIVKFGAGTATVISASDSILSVIVPGNATYDHITVARNSVLGYSRVKFDPTFPGSRGSFAAHTFEHVLDSATGAGPTALAVGDFNRDGKTDLAVLNSIAGRMTIYQNRTDSSRIVFETPILKNLVAGVRGVGVGDFHGSGNVDFAVGNTSTGGWYLVRNPFPDNYNTYSASNLPFPSKPFKIKSRDFDGNGTPDAAALSKQAGGNGLIQIVGNESAGTFGYYPNLSAFATDWYPTDLLLEDFDNDGKPDIMVSDSLNGLYYYSNISNDNIQFSGKQAIISNTNIQAIASIDFNNDGKMDIVAVGIDNNVRLFLNTTTNGNISFAGYETSILSKGLGVTIADIDGDGLPDVCTYSNTNQLVLLHNAGKYPLLFDSFYQFTARNAVADVVFADLDGDDKPEMMTANYDANSFSVYRNQVGEPVTFFLCSGQPGLLSADVAGSNYHWQVNTGNGYQNISDAALYSGFNTETLNLKQPEGSWYGYKYRLLADGNISSEYVLKFQSQWNGNAGTNWNNPANWSCGSVPDAYTDVVIDNGTVVITTPVVVRSLKLDPGVQVSVAAGGSLTILK